MKTFEINSWVDGSKQRIIVTEPSTWDSTEFKLRINECGSNTQFIIKLENGHWRYISFDDTANYSTPKQLEIDSIGFEVARYWCSRLEQQLENFQICL